MNIIQDFLTDRNLWDDETRTGNWHKGREGKTPFIVVMHATADNNINSSRNHFRNRNSQASSHYIVNTNGDIYQEVREEDTAYHAGVSEWAGDKNINDVSIGVEMTNLNNGKDAYDLPQYNATVELVRDIVLRRDIKRENVPTHAQVAKPKGRKNDPLGFPMKRFLDDVFAIIDPWALWGNQYPIITEQKAWKTPQTWLKNQWLGPAESFETYIDSNTSITLFKNGELTYRKPNDTVYIIKY